MENGPGSRYARYFDIHWNAIKPELRGKVLLPVLGDSYGAVLDRGEITLDTGREDEGPAAGQPVARYFEHVLPLAPGTERIAQEHPDGPGSPAALRACETAGPPATRGGNMLT